jgi:hypothetical protein
MEINQLTALLVDLTGSLRSSGNKEQKEIEKLQKSVAEAILHQDPSKVRSKELVFEKSDLALASNLESNRLKKISHIASLVSKSRKPAKTNVFVRNVPVRSTQITGGINYSSAGTRVKTIGPFTDIYGVSHWFDFVNVVKLIALFVKGRKMPVILFNATFRRPTYQVAGSIPVELTKTFHIAPDTIWIHGKLFSADVPDDYYCGLRVKGGIIDLDTLPFIENNHLTVTNATIITCDLNLEQNDSSNSNPDSHYGRDARNAVIKLPESFQFFYKENKMHINALSKIKWTIYGQNTKFVYNKDQKCIYNSSLGRVGVPLRYDPSSFTVKHCESTFCNLSGSAEIINSWWALSVTRIDISHPLEADGNGAILAECGKGLYAKWTGLQNKSISLINPFILGEPGRISITDLISDGSGAFQQFNGWKAEENVHKTTLECRYRKKSIFIFENIAAGIEVISGLSDWDIKTDRPMKVNGEVVAIRTKGSAFIVGISDAKNLLMVTDENILWDNKLPSEKIPKITPYALALHNALFTVTPPNCLFLFAEATPNLKVLTNGTLILAFGLFSYLPTLPDPYAANIGIFNSQFKVKQNNARSLKKSSRVWFWLLGMVKWRSTDRETFKVDTSFHFAPLAESIQIQKETEQKKERTLEGKGTQVEFSNSSVRSARHNWVQGEVEIIEKLDTNSFADINQIDFSLLDVSSNANHMGVSFARQNNGLQNFVAREYKINITDDYNASVFPVNVNGLDVVTAGMNAQAFTVPIIAWEPVFNLTSPVQFVVGSKDADGVLINDPGISDPPVGFNYYQNDGIPTRIGNLSAKQVPLSPIHMADFLVKAYHDKNDGKTFAFFNLPFGMLALTVLNNKSEQAEKPDIQITDPVFYDDIKGGIQFDLTAGTSLLHEDESNMFEGFTVQLININNPSGNPTGSSTLAGTPTQIFNNEFYTNESDLSARPGVPITGIGISGYGASMLSEWQNKEALFAQTSQAHFNVITGRTSHEVVQVKSMLYPWGIRVVRTITLFRLANGYVARIDSGWKAESDGKYNFSYHKVIVDVSGIPEVDDEGHIMKDYYEKPFIFHPGIIRGLFNVRNIKEQPKVFRNGEADLKAVTFDADIELENVTEGVQDNHVPSKGILAYVQIAPAGRPIDTDDFTALLRSENNSIGGPVDCILKVAGTFQRMKINRFDVAAAVDINDNPIFVCAARGSVILPKDGSWTMVQHTRRTGDVSPLPEQLSLPLIRIGEWVKDMVVSDNDVINNLLSIANPEDLLKLPDDSTLNFGFLQSMGTQKVLFIRPEFKFGLESLLSKTPPLFADSFRLLNSNGIFPNIGNLENDFGQAISLLSGLDGLNNPVTEAFESITIDGTNKVFKLLELQATETEGKLLDQGYTLLKTSRGVVDRLLKFDLPSFDYPLINLPGKLVIAIQYKASSNTNGSNYAGMLDFDLDSFASNLEDTWKGRMNNLSIVVSIGPLIDVIIIKGNFNSQKGIETDFGSSTGPAGLSLPTPEIEFSEALQPVEDVLEILASLSTGAYSDVLKKGLKIAMSNSANIWEYKFEANKDIPLVKFPPGALYDSPGVPLKLEASMGLGIFFNAALKVTTDPSQLLPSAGGYFKFHGGLQVMCATIGGASIYAVGNVDLKLEADTSPRIAVTMKFGFGAQIAVGLPVVGNASVLIMVGVEVFADSSSVVKITAFMLFRGHAELLGGLVGVTISIEAKGSVEKSGVGAPTNCKAQVTFAIDISIFLVIDISFSESWEETRQIA